MANSSRAAKPTKPQKPYEGFPLYAHANGHWTKRIKGRLVYFGKWTEDPSGEQALDLWLDQRDDLMAGREPRKKRGELTVMDLANHFLTHKLSLLESGELTQRTLNGYRDACDFMLNVVGKHRTASDIGPDDFAKIRARLAKRFGPVSLANKIQVIRSAFKYGYDVGLLDKPARFGLFKKPRAKIMREVRLAKGDQDFTAAEVRRLLDASTVNLRGMILLGIQGGFGNTDVAELNVAAVDLNRGWLDFARAKTATHRRVPLWPETVEAIRAAMEARPHESELVFIGRRGEDYIGKRTGYRVAREFKRATRDAGIEGKGFYCLRRTFQTVGEDARDLVAVQAIMGHIAPETDMSARYRQRVSDDRLRAVTNHVHAWLWPRPTTGGNGGVA